MSERPIRFEYLALYARNTCIQDARLLANPSYRGAVRLFAFTILAGLVRVCDFGFPILLFKGLFIT
jgi:hypothetical protein